MSYRHLQVLTRLYSFFILFAWVNMSGGEVLETECVGHKEREKLEEFIKNIPAERKTKPIKTDGFLNVNCGPQYKKLTLKEVQDTYERSKEWENIKSFSSIPNFEKRYANLKEHTNEMMEKHEKLLVNNPEARAEEIMQADGDFKRFEALQTNEAELIIKDHILKGMDGSPGLLLRSVHTEKVASQSKMENYSALADLGIVIPPYNCQHEQEHAENNSHVDQCYQSENDFILFYVEGEKLCLRFIEVKRPNTTPWATEQKFPGVKMIQYCLYQLEKGINFILSIIPDIPSSCLDIKAFSAFPETPCASLFCQDCQRRIISKEDLEKMRTNSKQLRGKLEISGELETPKETSLEYLLAATSRLVGKASLLHCGKRDLGDPFKQGKQTTSQNIQKHETNLIKSFWFLNKDQRELLQQASETSDLKNFCFVGGSGTGKTQMAIEVIKKLLLKHDGQKPTKLFIASCQQGQDRTGETELLKHFKEQKFKSENLEIQILTLGKTMKLLQIFEKFGRNTFNVPGKNMYKMPMLIEAMCKRFEEVYTEENVIFFLDEIMTFGNSESLNWKTLKPGPSINLLLAFSPVSLEKGTKQIVSNDEESSETSECLQLPTDPSFYIQKLNLRYRNSINIQKLTCFIGQEIGKYLSSAEEPATNVVGDIPVWIDIATDLAKLKPALEFKMKKYIKDDKKSDMVLLYDRSLSSESKAVLTSLEESRKNGGFGWKVMEERLFHGCECDTVIYVGSGHLEAFTRAQLKLLIVTFTENLESPWYKTYQKALKSAAISHLLKEETLVE